MRTVSVRVSGTTLLETLIHPTVERKSMTHPVMHGTGLTMYRMELLQRTRMYIRSPKPEHGVTEPVTMERPTESGYAMMLKVIW